MGRECKAEEPATCPITIRHLMGRQLRVPLTATVEAARPGFVAYVTGICVFGYGDDAAEAVEVLKQGIENMCRNPEFHDLQPSIQRILLLDNLTDQEGEGEKS